jgi:hypothetical protein
VHLNRWLIILAILMAPLGVVSVAMAGLGQGSTSVSNPPSNQTFWFDTTQPQGSWVVRAYFTSREQVERVAERVEPWEVNTSGGYLVLEVNPSTYQWLLDLGLRIEVDPVLTLQLNQPAIALPGQITGIPGYPCYRTVEETYDSAQQIVNDHPTLATWIDIGDSWEKIVSGGNSGYDLMVLKLTNSEVPGPKPKIFLLSSIHAREYAPAELNTRFAEYLVSHYGSDPDITWLLDYQEIHLLLQSNPDGRKQAEQAISWRKNTDNNYCPNTTDRGIDLNRNFDFLWGCCGGSSGFTCDETFRGPTASSEPETQAIQNYIRSIFPDQRAEPETSPAPSVATGVFIDLHSYGQLVLWPWGFTNNPSPNNAGLSILGQKLAYFNQYTPEQSYDLYPTDGTTDDFAYGDLGVAGFTIEMGSTFFEDCSAFQNTILPDNLSALLYAAKVARLPYQLPSGPDSLSVIISPTVLSSGQIVAVSAQIDATRYKGNPATLTVAGAEVYADTPPWITSTVPLTTSMVALDGGFDEKVEDVTASIDPAGLSQGRHLLFVRGRDTDGNWGPVSAGFLYVVYNSIYLPQISK